MRPALDQYFMSIAEAVATRSTCLRHHVGAVIVSDGYIVTTGYNGAPRGLPHCLDVGCIRDHWSIPSGTRTEVCAGIHAEQNAIIQAALHGVSTKDSTIYVTHQPCIICAKMLINAGIRRVVYGEEYQDIEGLKLFENAGIPARRFVK